MAHDQKHSEYHITPLSTYLTIFAILIVCTGITVMAAGRFGHADVIVAMGIATLKASLVLLFFMHLKYENMMNRVIIGSGFFFLLLLFAFSAFDLYTRIDATPK